MANQEIRVPDIGDFKDVDVIEVLVAPGDRVQAEDPLITLESDKAAMDIPAPAAGTIKEIKVKAGDKVSEGSLIGTLETGEAAEAPAAPAPEPSAAPAPEPPAVPAPAEPTAPDQAHAPPGKAPPVAAAPPVDETAFATAHATPLVRRFARELGVDIDKVPGSGRKGRITEDDVKAYVKQVMTGTPAAAPAAAPAGAKGIEPIPAQDFAKFGPIETKPLSRIKKLSGAHLHRVWLNLPMVTVDEDADITETEVLRKQLSEEYKKQEVRVTMLSFLLKASAAALKAFPEVNASLDPSGENLILKQYCHIGVAVDTPEGLVVPVIRDVDKKGLVDLSKEMGEISLKARDGKLKGPDLQGGCFTISSLGGIGGTGFTPIVNAPEVAILGVTRSKLKPVWDGHQFVPRMMLPLSLSFDHRVIDGAAGTRFLVYLASRVADVRRLLL